MTDACAEAYASRANQIDYAHLEERCYIGRYQRLIPVSLRRMMENAHDWEHLPFVHSSTFSDIVLIDSGDWGWRAELGSAKSKGRDRSVIELLVDNTNHYWATTVLSGQGKGVEIHTQARARGEREISIDVRFFLPQQASWARRTLTRWVLRRQYHRLYEEDQALMSARQQALDEQRRWNRKDLGDKTVFRVGLESDLDRQTTHLVDTGRARYSVKFWRGQWRAYSATCPHQLGNLQKAKVSDDGIITCPWHGYRFLLETGVNLDDRCAALETPAVMVAHNTLFLECKS